MGQVVTQLDSVDEYDFFAKSIRAADQEYTQYLTSHSLTTPVLQGYLKQILQSKRVLIPLEQKEQVMLPRRILKVKRKMQQQKP
jgi:hypothetical protein